ncbi:MAG: hypothetical protein NC347_04530 [Clostridium sp.]|nr:hypothetical protein [Clostridium sp.]
MSGNKEFRSWLERNTCGNYKGIEINPETKLVRYTYVISLIVITYRRQTAYYFLEAEAKEAAMAKLLCCLCNLTVGWWGFPWGPIWTVKETFCNLINSNSAKWGQFLKTSSPEAEA